MKFHIALFSIAALALACATTEEKKTPEVEKPEMEAVAAVIDYQAMTELYNAGKYDAALGMFTEDVKGTASGEVGVAGIKKRWVDAEPLSPKVAVARYVEGEGMWVAQGVMHGAHTGEYRGMAASEKPYAVDYLHIGWTDDAGRTKELLSLTSTMAIAAQLELMKGPPAPPMAAIPAKTEMIKGAANAANVAAAKAVYAAYEAGEQDKLAEHIADNAVVYMRAHGKKYEGLDAIKTAMSAERNAFTERSAETNTASVGDVVVVWGKVTAKHTGQVGPTPPTNKMVSWHFADVLVFEGGKLVEGSFYYNPGEVMRQLGDRPAH